MTLTYRGRHRAVAPSRLSASRPRLLAALAAVAATLGILLGSAALGAPQASAATLAYGGSRAGNVALSWAESHNNGIYAWGGNGPSFDCSGLVAAGFRHAGITLPRTSYAMPSSPHLHWVPLSQARRGDILVWGPARSPYHVGFKTIWPDTAYEARNTASGIGWFSTAYFQPSAAYRVW